MNKNPTVEMVQHKGEFIDAYSVDEGLDNSNAGGATLYRYKGKLWEVVVWNARALDHKAGSITMSEIVEETDE